jgi:hypothetical protein
VKAWGKLSLEGSKDNVLKAIAMHKARMLREAQTPEEEVRFMIVLGFGLRSRY